MNELSDALRRAATVLRDEGIPYMVIGGIANLVWGAVRTTTDLDLTVDVEAGLDRFLGVAEQLGEHLPDDPRDVAERGRLVAVRTPEGIRIDLALATLPFEVDAIRRARRVSILGVDVAVCSPEDLIIMKSVASRPQDELDVVGVLRRQGQDLDLERLDSTIEGLAADLAEPAIAERWRAAKEAAGLPSD